VSDIADITIDWESALGSLKDFRLLRTDFEDLYAMSRAAVNRFLAADLRQYNVTQVENKWSREFEDVPVYGTPDLELGLLSSRPGVTNLIVDWKTASAITPEKVEQYRISWQSRIYCWARNCDRFEYRLIGRPPMAEADPRLVPIRSLPIKLNPIENKQLVENYLSGILGMRDALDRTAPWPMNRPFACHSYGRPCPHIKDCHADNVSDEVLELAAYPLNNSGANLFQLCPERYRRSVEKRISGWEDGEGGSAAYFGSAFAVLMASIYSQFMQHPTSTQERFEPNVNVELPRAA
jgi:hypothetical protein